MIEIKEKKNCCGCRACATVCVKHCISMQADEEGFLYPIVDKDACSNCDLCEKVCPVINQSESRKPLKVYAAKNKNEEIRRQSSSGGIFTLLAEKVIEEGGVVFGARFDDNWDVIHSWTDTIEGIAAFRGSKYVQSTIGDTYREAKDFLKQGRNVLFSGTPCQIAGLKKYIRKDYDNLLTVDVVCHGVPSPKIWKEYLESLQLSNIGAISHKDKSTGWRGYSFSVKDTYGKIVYTEKACDNKYLSAFVRNYILRPSCFSCPAKAGKSLADITLADYWGIEHFVPQLDDNKGTSFVCSNTQKGVMIVDSLNLISVVADYQKSLPYNSCIVQSTNEPKLRKNFWVNYKKEGINVLSKIFKANILKRILKRLLR